MNILICTDNNYVDLTCVLINSIVKNNPNCKIDFYVLHPGLNDESFNKLKQIGNMNLIQVDNSKFESYKMHSRITNTAFSRLLASEYLPKKVHKILYLDCDILTVGSINDLYNKTFDNNTMYMAGSECENSKENFMRLGINTDDTYVNSGVLLMNLDKCREVIDIDEIVDFIENHKSDMIYKDQDVINGLYHEYIKLVPAREYNYINFKELSKKQFVDNTKNTKILHFAGMERYKPWRVNYIGLRYIKKLYKNYVTDSKKLIRDMKLNNVAFPFCKIYYFCYGILYNIYCRLFKKGLG